MNVGLINELVYQVPEFTADPARCDITYSYGVTPSKGTDGTTFEAAARQFTFNFPDDVTYVGTYDIVVTGKITYATQFTEDVSFTLNVLDPCLDPDSVTISGVVPDEQRYVLYANSESEPMTFAHDAFTMVLKDTAVQLDCGEFTYSATFDGGAI